VNQCLRRAVFCTALALLPGTLAAQERCDRACMRSMLDQYLSAVIAHDSAKAPLLAGFRQTENAVVVPLGAGLWKTMTGLGAMQRRYVDPVSGQAAYFGVVQEGPTSAIVTVRIRVEDRKITEAEWYVARQGDPGLNPGRGGNLFDPDYLTMNPPAERVIPAAKRSSRASLAAIVNSYFDGISSHNGAVVLAHPGCTRVENGTLMTGGRRGGGAGPRAGGAAPPAAPGPPASTDCVAGFATINIAYVAARRVPVIDEEAGVALATAVFIRPPASPNPRNAFAEWFVIDEGKIRNIYSAMFYPGPTLAVPNWPPYDGNWPLPAGIVPPPPAAAPATAGAGQN